MAASSLEWNGWREWYEDDILIFDGDPETAYLGDGRYLRVVGYGPQRKYWVFDFGGRFFVDRVRFYPRSRFAATRFVESFILGTSDGDPLVDGTREYEVSWLNSSLDFDIVHRVRENTQAVMELTLPGEPIQQVFIEDVIQVELTVFDLAGRAVGVIYTGPATSGRFVVEWDGRTPKGHLVPPGSYLVRLTAETDLVQQQRQRLVSVVY